MNKNQEPIWYWDKKPIKITDLDQKQLYAVKDAVSKSKKPWFGHTKRYWLDQIDPLLKIHERENIKRIVSNKNERRLRDATKMADMIINVFNKPKQSKS